MPKKHATFLIFSEYLQDLIDNDNGLSRIQAVEKIWSNVVDYFEYFKEWFESRTLYHYIGLLVTLKGNQIIEPFIQQAKKISKSKFKKYLEKEIGETFRCRKPIDKLVYEDENGKKTDYKDILNLLLLHNVYTTLISEEEKPRFPFELYKKIDKEQKWTLEHIYARNSKPLNDTAKQKEWLADHIQSLSNSNAEGSHNNLISKMEIMKKQEEIDNIAFETIEEEVYDAIDKCFEFGQDENVHLIKNLCLLDGATNSQLSNSVFDVKREKIKSRESNGSYIPVCTKKVFLKAYTSFPKTNAYWTQMDREGYFKDIENTYNFFMNKSTL